MIFFHNIIFFILCLLVNTFAAATVEGQRYRLRQSKKNDGKKAFTNNNADKENQQQSTRRHVQQDQQALNDFFNIPHEEDIDFENVDPQSIRGGFTLSQRPWFVYFAGGTSCGGALVHADSK